MTEKLLDQACDLFRLHVESRGSINEIKEASMSEPLSDDAVALFRLHRERKGKLPVDDANRALFRELAGHGLMIPGHSFAEGRESFYALTEVGAKFQRVLERLDEVAAVGAAPIPSNSQAASSP